MERSAGLDRDEPVPDALGHHKNLSRAQLMLAFLAFRLVEQHAHPSGNEVEDLVGIRMQLATVTWWSSRLSREVTHDVAINARWRANASWHL
jgi:hypothetical protein